MTVDSAILVVGPAWVGDMVMAQTLFKTLKNDHPTVAIDLLAPPWTLPLAARMAEIRQAIPMPLGHGELGLTTRFRLGRSLQGKYTQAIVLPNSLKAALLPFFAAIPTRTGFLGELRWGLINDIRSLNKQRLPRTIDRFIALGRPPNAPVLASPPIPCLHATATLGKTHLTRFGLTDDQAPILVLAPGAEYGAAKRWPTQHFATLARAKVQAGWQVVILGSAKESQLGEEILTASGQKNLLNLAGRLSLDEAVDVMACATAVVTNDSGLMHVAAALQRPGVALFGSSDPKHTPPLGGSLTILSLALDCAPCFQRECPKQHLDCLQKITPEMVLEVL